MKSNNPRLAGVVVVGGLAFSLPSSTHGGQDDIPNPAGGDSAFGASVTVLPNGNFVVTDPEYDAPGPVEDVGAVYLYDGVTLEIISTLTGSTGGDRVGGGGATQLDNGNFLVHSPSWDHGVAVDAGALTWVSGTAGINGVVSATNSLVGSTENDRVGGGGIGGGGIGTVVLLTNGHFVVRCPDWDNGDAVNAGAVTWLSGTAGITGPVSAVNSLVGSSPNDRVGWVTALANGNFVVSSPDWDDGAVANVGAVTWGDGTTGVTGPVSAANSLVGGTANDQTGGGNVGFSVEHVTPLTNGNYVVSSPSWHNEAADSVGAVTWANGATGITGPVDAANSLVGGTAGDQVGFFVMSLVNGNYVVASPFWDNGGTSDAGAATWGSGTVGVSGAVSAANSLIGSIANDTVGYVVPLANGNYVVASSDWDDGAVANVGAVTWGNGATGITGPVSAANSLVGSTANDRVGFVFPGSVVNALPNGNYVVSSPDWDNGTLVDAGAVTWGNGTTGITGPVSAANSLVGSTAGDGVGNGNDQRGVAVLPNGNYVVSSTRWSNDGGTSVGAVTWADGNAGNSGPITAANSLVGTSDNDDIGVKVTVLASGNYVVSSPSWDDGEVANVGAVTWGDGTTGITGQVTSANSLVGSTLHDRIGDPFFAGGGVTALANGNYVVSSPDWDDGLSVNVGAATWGSGTAGIGGVVSDANSLVGRSAGDNVGREFGPIPGITALPDGHYAVSSRGALSLGDGTDGTSGLVSTFNSILDIDVTGFAYDLLNSRLLVGEPRGKHVILFGYSPEIRIEQPLGVNLASGGSALFGAPLGADERRTFVVRNTGLGDLTGLGSSISGSDAGLFTVTVGPAAVLRGPLGSTTITVRFAPDSAGEKSATLRVASNDADENPYEINLSGREVFATEDTDGDSLNDAAESQLATLGFDWQISQPALVETFFGNANLAGLYTVSQVQALHVDAPLIQRDADSGLFTLTIGVKKSTDLMDFSPFPISGPQTTINLQGKLEFEFSVTDDAAFFRLEAE